jgi:endonuclease/exonuclease/phosphatase family metal-dependent hydrolase
MNTFQVATLNLWNVYGPWAERKKVLHAQIQALGADVIGLQEVFRQGATPGNNDAVDQIGELASLLGYQFHFGAAYNEQNGETGNGVLSRWPIVTRDTVALSAGNNGEARCIAMAMIDAPFGKLPFASTHLNYKLHDSAMRCSQVREVDNHFTRFASSGAVPGTFPGILVGDFNAEPESDEMRFLRGLTALGGASVYYADAFAVAGSGPGATFCKDNTFAEPWREPERRIDYIFVRHPDFKIGEPLSALRCFDTPIEGVFATDHYGVVATIRIE